MTITCSACSWPDPALISAHGAVRYWRCLCGQWLVSEADALTASPGGSDLAETRARTVATAEFGRSIAGPAGRVGPSDAGRQV